MQGLVNFAAAVGEGLAIFLPTFCYLTAIGLFLFAGWGFWRQAQPDNPYRGKPWIPIFSLVLCGVFASFDRILTMANVTMGTDLQVSLTNNLTTYAPAVDEDVLGTTPGTTLLNIVTLFQSFFQAFGAMACFFAALTWWSIVTGRTNRSTVGTGIQFVFGILLINVMTVATWLVSIFQT
ncbi:hypothetical protein [Beijerinckia mobilis]|uniref:hypothetical protein n=1 Tax=Beijerinckia mobilis TaxID=231434 RepID=UPI00054EA1A7|nr:hypothetical protein [Beijerinckia mobilis]